jgi:acyl dehydratase
MSHRRAEVEHRVDELRSLIGTQVTGPEERVELNDIRDFAEAIRWPADPLPRYVDEAAAARTWAGGIVAPPTYLSRLARIRGFSLPMPVPGWWSPLPGILASVEVELLGPIRPGDVLTPEATIRDILVQEAAHGTLVGIERDFEFTNRAGERVGRTRRTVAKFLDGSLFDRTDLPDALGGLPAPGSPEPGDIGLPPFSRPVTLMELNRFAGANREWGLYHMDPDFARTLGLHGALVIEHLKLAYLANMLEDWLDGSARIRTLAASFLALDVVPTTLTTGGVARPPCGDDGIATDVSVWIADDRGRIGTIGRASVGRG